jgi:hypothetical protein
MPNYDKLRDMVSHRCTFEFDTGARVIGYMASCKPATGPVLVTVLTRVDIFDPAGKLIEHHNELSIVPNLLTGFRVAEGPGASG